MRSCWKYTRNATKDGIKVRNNYDKKKKFC